MHCHVSKQCQNPTKRENWMFKVTLAERDEIEMEPSDGKKWNSFQMDPQ